LFGNAGAANPGQIIFACNVDGTITVGSTSNAVLNNSQTFNRLDPTAGNFFLPGTVYDWVYTPTPGSHLFTMMWYAGLGTVKFGIAAPYMAGISIEESVRQNSSNGSA
jgi:hypothetical protein